MLLWLVSNENDRNLDLRYIKSSLRNLHPHPVSETASILSSFRNIGPISLFVVFHLHTDALTFYLSDTPADPSTLLSFHPLMPSFPYFPFHPLGGTRSICLFFQRISQPARLKSWTIRLVIASRMLVDRFQRAMQWKRIVAD